MKNTSSIWKLGLVSAWLISSLACGAMNKTAENSSNRSASNANSNADNTAAVVNKKDPKIVCAYLPDFQVGSKYKFVSSLHLCLSGKTEKLASGTFNSFTYGAYGDADNIENVNLVLTSDNKGKDAVKAEEYFVEQSNILWQKVFDVPLPAEIKAELQKNKGKMIAAKKEFKEPVLSSVIRTAAHEGIYRLELEFWLPK